MIKVIKGGFGKKTFKRIKLTDKVTVFNIFGLAVFIGDIKLLGEL